MDLVSEMKVMKTIGKHKNIINLLGVCTQEGNVPLSPAIQALLRYKPFAPFTRFLWLKIQNTDFTFKKKRPGGVRNRTFK